MGNQARQRQELELWQVVSPPGNVSRPVRQKRAARNAGPRTMEPVRVRNPKTAVPVRTGYPRKSGNINTINIRTAGTSRTGSARARTAGAVRTGTSRTVDPIRMGNPGRRANVQALNRRKAIRRQRMLYRSLAAIWIMVLVVTVIFLGKILYQNVHVEEAKNNTIKPVFEEIPVLYDDSDKKKPKIQEDFLTISEYNRPGTELACVNNIFVHYTANPKTSAAQNRSYFENLGVTHERAASAHFIIGYEGEIIQCIPLEEEAYAVVERNGDSVSIECCFIEEDGSFTQETYDSLIAMLAWLTDKYNLQAKDILRHYDCGGKLCPLYYVEHEDAWERLLYDVEHYKF